jgi:hypothetical protein
MKRLDPLATEKECTGCGLMKPMNEFGLNRRSTDLRKSECKECTNKKTRKFRKTLNYPISVVSKVCLRCHTEKPASEFARAKKEKDGLFDWCKECKRQYFIDSKVNWTNLVSVTHRICPRCQEDKPASEYNKKGRYKSGLETYCKECRLKDQHRINSTLRGYITNKISSTRRNSKKLNREFSITIQDVLEMWIKQGGKCYYSGMPMEHHASGSVHTRNPSCLTIDRIDSSLGYTIDNVVLCCWIVNRMKNDLTVRQFIELCTLVSQKVVSKDDSL